MEENTEKKHKRGLAKKKKIGLREQVSSKEEKVRLIKMERATYWKTGCKRNW